MDNHNMEHRPDQEQASYPAGPYEAAHMAPSTNLPLRKPSRRRMDGKTVGLIIAGCVAVVAIAGFCVWSFWLKNYLAAKDASPVYVTPVSSITGALTDTDPRYSGLVEPQKITNINKDDTRTVSDVLVTEGDQVNIGDVLFSYDTGEIDLSIRQVQLELEGIGNEITTLQDQKKTLEAEKKKATSDEQFRYTVEIQSVEHQIKSQEYQRSVKQSELDKLRNSLENNQVFSEVEGVVQQVNLTPATDSMGQPLPFISILSSGEFRIKGTVTELNINSLYTGQPVTVRSRVNSELSWQGSIDTIDYEPVQDNNNMYYYGMDSGEKASKYNFYVTMDTPGGLILGQHVYIEPDNGTTAAHSGLWLPEMYVVVDEDGSGHVWARDEDEKLEFRPVTLGEYDSGEGLYEILSGLEASDYIAYPMEGLVVGGPTTTDASAMVMPGDDMMADPGFVDGDGAVIAEGGLDGSLDGYYDEEGNFIPNDGSADPFGGYNGDGLDGEGGGISPESPEEENGITPEGADGTVGGDVA